jgi:hypothetical protein
MTNLEEVQNLDPILFANVPVLCFRLSSIVEFWQPALIGLSQKPMYDA